MEGSRPGSPSFAKLLDSVPAEIWYQILECVIDAPFIFDTTIGAEGCYWFKKDRFHERSVYIGSETQRRAIRLVCRGWMTFADNNRWRWLRFYERSTPVYMRDARHVEDALAHASNGRLITGNEDFKPVFPRRASFGVDSDDSKDTFIKMINQLPSRLTILFVDCEKRHGSSILEHILANSSAMPCMRCLMLSWVDFRETPLQAVSRAFPLLTGLTFVNGIVPHNTEDFLSLRQLESLCINKVKLRGMRPETWLIPDLLRLILAIDEADSAEMAFDFAKPLGKSLVLFRTDTLLPQFHIPNDIWRYFPRLTELVMPVSVAEVLTPVPAGHPLRYVIHKGSIQTLNTDPLRQRFQSNIISLGDDIEILIMADLDWKRVYRDGSSDASAFLERLSMLLEVKGARLVDMHGRTLHVYMQVDHKST